jgi:hypothetical protein
MPIYINPCARAGCTAPVRFGRTRFCSHRCWGLQRLIPFHLLSPDAVTEIVRSPSNDLRHKRIQVQQLELIDRELLRLRTSTWKGRQVS